MAHVPGYKSILISEADYQALRDFLRSLEERPRVDITEYAGASIAYSLPRPAIRKSILESVWQRRLEQLRKRFGNGEA